MNKVGRWKKTPFKGVRYREHPTRKHGIMPDRYYTIRYYRDGKGMEEKLGWASDKEGKWTAEKAAKVLAGLTDAYDQGKAKPTRLFEARQAEKKRRERETEEKKQIEKENLTFGQFFKETYFPISRTSKKPESSKKEEEHFRLYLEPLLGNKPFRDIKPLTMERIKKNILEAGRSPRFLQYCLATFRQIWNMARRDGIVFEESPSRQVKILKIENKRTRFLNREEAENLLNHLKVFNLTVYRMAYLSLYTGMRFGEIATLKWGAVDLDRGLITILDAKGNKSRPAFMPEELRKMFNDLPKGNPEELVFPKENGEKYLDTPTTFREAVVALGLNQGVTDHRQKVVFHTLRHTYASWLAEAGTDIYAIGKLLGHSTVQMSARYAHLGPGAMQEAVKRLPSLTTTDRVVQEKIVRLKKK